jgi:cell filamentation protein
MFDPFGDFESRGYLRNKRKDKSPVVIKHMEHNLFRANLADALAYLADQDVIEYRHFLAVHRILFGNYYPWAGEDRLMTAPHLLVSKSDTTFCEPRSIHLAINQGLRLAQLEQRMADVPGEIMGLFAYGHPFLDGNGRTMLLVHMELAHRAGFTIDWPATNKDDYLRALTLEIESPGRGILDKYLLPFCGPEIDRNQWADKVLAMKGLDGLDDENQVEGDLRDASVAERYRLFDEARNYSYRHAESGALDAVDDLDFTEEEQHKGSGPSMS